MEGSSFRFTRICVCASPRPPGCPLRAAIQDHRIKCLRLFLPLFRPPRLLRGCADCPEVRVCKRGGGSAPAAWALKGPPTSLSCHAPDCFGGDSPKLGSASAPRFWSATQLRSRVFVNQPHIRHQIMRVTTSMAGKTETGGAATVTVAIL
jgi:hypothetical protein